MRPVAPEEESPTISDRASDTDARGRPTARHGRNGLPARAASANGNSPPVTAGRVPNVPAGLAIAWRSPIHLSSSNVAYHRQDEPSYATGAPAPTLTAQAVPGPLARHLSTALEKRIVASKSQHLRVEGLTI
jgi:hypothetical protein